MHLKGYLSAGIVVTTMLMAIPATAAQGSFSYTHNGVDDPYFFVAHHAVTDNQGTMSNGSVIRNVSVVFTEPTFYYNVELGNEEEKSSNGAYWNDFYCGYRTTGGAFSVNWFKDARSLRNQQVSYVLNRVGKDSAQNTSSWKIEVWAPDGITYFGPVTTNYQTVYQSMIATYNSKNCTNSVRSAWHSWRYQDSTGLKWFYGAVPFDTQSCSPVLYGRHSGDPNGGNTGETWLSY